MKNVNSGIRHPTATGSMLAGNTKIAYAINYMSLQSKTSNRIRLKSGVGLWTMPSVALLSLLLALLWLSMADACEVPVFRYALDNWPADAYEALIVHQDDDGVETSLALLREAVETTANLVVREAQPHQIPASFAHLLSEQPVDSRPWLILRFPVRQETRRTVLAAPLDRERAARCLDSPLRQELTRLLLKGRTSVWILLESGHRSKDKRAHDLLAGELARLERTLHLPEAFTSLENKAVSFPILRLSPQDPQETELIAMLRGSEPDLAQRKDEPMVFPVFGRGIILYALIGDGINTTTITEAAEFMTGSCACEVKSQNPGVELLLSADWGASRMGGIADFSSRSARAASLMTAVEAAPIPGMVADIPADRGMPQTNTAPSGTSRQSSSNQRVFQAILRLTLIGAAVLIGVWLTHRWRRNNR